MLFFFTFGEVLAQQATLDSLIAQEKAYPNQDTVKVKKLIEICRGFTAINSAKGLEFINKAIEIATKLEFQSGLSSALSAKGNNCFSQTDYLSAMDAYQKALVINEDIKNKQGIANNLNNIGLIYYSVLDYPKAQEYYHKALKINDELKNIQGVVNSFGNIGNIFNEMKDYPKALEYYNDALTAAKSLNNQPTISGIYNNLGNVYTQLARYDEALQYKLKALEINEKLGNKSRIAYMLDNVGNVYTKMGNYQQALLFHQKASPLHENLRDDRNLASNQLSFGNLYFQTEDLAKAKAYFTRALAIARRAGLTNLQYEILLNQSKIHEKTSQFDSAYYAYNQYIILRDSFSNKENQKQIIQYSMQYDFSKKEDSLKNQQTLTNIKLEKQTILSRQQQQELLLKQASLDLSNRQKEIQHLAFLKTQSELMVSQAQKKQREEQLTLMEREAALQASQVKLQQAELLLKDSDLRKQTIFRYFYISLIGLLGLLSFFVFRNFINQKKSNQIISVEKKKSDDLLLNILPEEVAQELKEKGTAQAKLYENVTILFTDFVGFTKVAEQLTPEQLVNELHQCFKAFDGIVERHHLEKIKTIGDAYMAVSGLPISSAEHAVRAAAAAQDMQQFIQARNQSRSDQSHTLQVRIGLHSGSVIAGIVGTKKFAFDIWGDAVNLASRMESSGEPGKINLSGSTYALIQSKYPCTYRGKIEAKNKGNVDMYFIS